MFAWHIVVLIMRCLEIGDAMTLMWRRCNNHTLGVPCRYYTVAKFVARNSMKNGTNNIFGSCFNFSIRCQMKCLQMSSVKEIISKYLFISRLPAFCPSLQSYHDNINASLIDSDQIRWIFFEKLWFGDWHKWNHPTHTPFLNVLRNKNISF